MTRPRPMLAFVGACWACMGVAYAQLSEALRWQPRLVSGLALLAAGLAVALAVWPRWAFAYRVGGTAAIGTLLFRLASIVLAPALGQGNDLPWVTIAAVAMTAMLTLMYGFWWLGPVKSWHESLRRADGSHG